MPTQTSERWIADGNAVKSGLEAAGYEVDLQFANDDIPTQTQQIDQMITNGATMLVIAAIDGTALSSQLDTAGAKNIPVIAYDRLIRDNENVDFYVSFDNFKVGVAQGNALLYGLGLPAVTGQDAEIASAEMINDGIQQSTIFKDTRTLAAQSVTVIKAMAEGSKPEANDTTTYNNGVKVVPSYLLEVETIYADNLKEKLIDSGYYTQADVDAGVVKK